MPIETTQESYLNNKPPRSSLWASGLAAVAVFLALFFHDRYLYSFMSYGETFVLSSLRFFLLCIPLVAGFAAVRFRGEKKKLIAASIVWFFFLPYTIYSMTEIRHVAETCRLGTGLFYTEQCVYDAWHLLPTFLYGFAGVLIFMFTTIQVSSRLFTDSTRNRGLFLLACCGYSAFASVFGLYSRVNMWEIVIHPVTVLTTLWSTVQSPGFVSNVCLFTLCFVVLIFFTHSVIRSAGKYISL